MCSGCEVEMQVLSANYTASWHNLVQLWLNMFNHAIPFTPPPALPVPPAPPPLPLPRPAHVLVCHRMGLQLDTADSCEAKTNCFTPAALFARKVPCAVSAKQRFSDSVLQHVSWRVVVYSLTVCWRSSSCGCNCPRCVARSIIAATPCSARHEGKQRLVTPIHFAASPVL